MASIIEIYPKVFRADAKQTVHIKMNFSKAACIIGLVPNQFKKE